MTPAPRVHAKARVWAIRGAALGAGAAAALAHPRFGLLPGLLGYALLLWLLDQPGAGRPLRAAFFRGWLAGLGYFTVSTWWVADAFFVDAKDQAWMAPFAVAFLAGGMALYWGIAGLAYRLLRPRGADAARLLVFAGALAGSEWLRGHLFTGFPWDLPGESWRAGSAPSQFASVVGAYGMTWLTIAIAAAPGLGARRRDEPSRHRPRPGDAGRPLRVRPGAWPTRSSRRAAWWFASCNRIRRSGPATTMRRSRRC